MTKVHRYLPAFLVLVLCLSLCACTKTDDGAEGRGPRETEAADTQEDDSKDNDSARHSAEELLSSFDRSATLEETVMWDSDGVKITATGLSYSNYSVDLGLQIENNTEENLSFISNSLGYSCNAINGYMVDGGYLNCDVSAGKIANNTISFGIDELLMYGISGIASIEIGFDIEDSDNNDIYTGPLSVATSLDASYDYDADTYAEAIVSDAVSCVYGYSVESYEQTEIYNQNDIRIISECLIRNEDGEYVLLLEAESNANDLVYVTTSNIVANGLVLYDYNWSSDSINPGNRRVIGLELSSMLEKEYLDMLGLTEIGELTFSVSIKDMDYNKISAPRPISITLSENTLTIDDRGDEVYNANGIRVISKGLVPDSSNYSEDIHLLLLVKNGYSEDIQIDDVYDSLSVNNYMTDYYCTGADIGMGNWALVDIEIDEDSLSDNGITDIADIFHVELSLEIRISDYDDIDSPVISVVFGDAVSAAVEDAADTEEVRLNDESEGVTPDFKAAMDAYEAFFDEYISFMQSYEESDDILGVISDYTDYMTQYADFMVALDAIEEDDLSAADLAYYTEVTARISQKLLSAGQ